MKYLKKINEMTGHDTSTKRILREGFDYLIRRSHLVSEQVSSNLNKFIDSLDIERFEVLFGKIDGFLGAGVFGAVFSLENGKIFKITFDYHEAPFLYEYCLLKKTPGFVKVDGVWNIEFGDTNAYLILRSAVSLLDYRDFSEHEDEIENAENAMYYISPGWRGTHRDNFAFQDREIVLYDGFCKKTPVDEKKIPLLKLSK